MKQRACRGFAMLAAIALLGLAGAAMGMLISRFGSEVSRTHLVWQEAQLHQLLLAGGHDAAARVANWPATAPKEFWKLPLPDALPANRAGVTLRSRILAADLAEIEVSATLEGREDVQTLSARRANGRWVINGARLGS